VSDRRRNLFVLLLVAGLLAGSLAAIFTKDTKLGLDLRGGVELIYQAEPTPQAPTITPENIERAIDVMRDRVDALGVAEPEIQRTGDNQIAVALPGVANAERAEEQVGQVAQLFFYDWEANVIGPDGRPAPADPNVTGGQAAGSASRPPAITQYEAIQRAEDRRPVRDGNNSHRGLYYVVNDRNDTVVAGPEQSREDVLEELPIRGQRERGERPLARGERIAVVPEGTTIVRAEVDDQISETNVPDAWYVLADNVALRGTDIRNPEQNFDQGPGGSGQPIVTFDFSDDGRRRWREVTAEIARRGQANQLPGTPAQAAAQHFAIVLDDELISVPFIDFTENPNGIDAANGSQIEGGFTIESAQELANLLKTGALPVRLELISRSQVSATLGQQSLDQGLVAALGGFAIVALFLVSFYRVLGLIAVTGLLVYGVYFYALIKLIPVTLTLPGIAGLVLTLGVAADANIVIFERVKEEIRSGRGIVSGIAAGYRKGITAIIDANVVTIMVAFILFVLATSGVRGFALTLGLGTIVSLFTAVLATQAVLGTLGRTRLLARRSALGAAGEGRRIRYDFMGKSKWFFSASGLILLICALSLSTQGLNLGIDFESGTRIRAALERPATEDQVRGALQGLPAADAEIQRFQEEGVGANGFQISTGTLRPDQVRAVESRLDDRFGIRGSPNTQSIGPTFGATVARNAIIAIIASLLVISIYLTLRFQWKYAVPVLIAVAHDILITAGIYALVGQEVTTSTVAALLTVLGFSLYDTIIVFDRVRENVPRMPRATFSQIVNRSMSEVIVRSLITNLCTVLPVLSLLLFGGETLRDFALALIVGTISGTYSSVFIAGQVLTHWKEREPVYRRRRAQIAAENDGVVPPYAETRGGRLEDVEPAPRKRARPSLIAPDDPANRQVSREEFDEMVRDLHADAPRTGTAVEEPPAPVPAPAPAPPRPSAPERAPDADPSELFMKGDGRDKQRKPRNRKHGRPR